MEKLESLKWLISDLLDLKEYYEQLEHAIVFENKETIDEIKKCIKDFNLNEMIKIIEELKNE